MSPTKKTEALALYEPSQFSALCADMSGQEIVEQIKNMGVGQFELPQLHVPAGGAVNWEIETLEGPLGVREIECIMVASKSGMRRWFREAYQDKEKPGPPECSSLDGIMGYGWRSKVQQLPEDSPSDQECLTCPFSQFGSDRNGRAGQDCTEYGLALMLTHDGILPSVLTIPPASLKPMKKYMLSLLNAGSSATKVVTKLTLTKVSGPPAYSTINFSYGGKLSDEAKKKLEDLAGLSSIFKQFAAASNKG